MSWDVVVSAVKWQPGMEASLSRPLGEAGDVRRQVSAALPDTNWSDPAWGLLERADWSIEFNTDAIGTVESMMLHVRGEGDPLSAISRLCQETGWFAFDTTTGEFLDPSNPCSAGWDDFRGFRDEIAASESQRARLEINWPVILFAVLIGLAIAVFKIMRQP